MRLGVILVPHGHRTHRSARGFLKGDHDVSFDIAAAFGHVPAGIKVPPRPRAAHPGTEHLLKKVAKPGAVEFKIRATGTAPECLAAPRTAVAGRRTELGAGLPIRAQLVIFLALAGIGKHLVSFVDLLEFFLRLLFVLGHVGMKFPRQLAKSLLDFNIGRRPGHPQTLVIIFVLHGHKKNLPVGGDLSKPQTGKM